LYVRGEKQQKKAKKEEKDEKSGEEWRREKKREKRGKGGVKGLYFRGDKGGYFKAMIRNIGNPQTVQASSTARQG